MKRFADQGFAVLTIDGRGTPGRSPGWEREVYLDLATSVLEDKSAITTAKRACRAAVVRRPRHQTARV